MKNITIERQMEVETVDCEGNTLSVHEVTLIGEIELGCRGSRDSYGQAMEPDTDDSIELLEVIREDGESISLNAEDEKRAEAILADALDSWQEERQDRGYDCDDTDRDFWED